MPKNAIVRARIEPELKEKVEIILNKIGLTPSQAIRLFLKQVELNNGLPFNLSIPNKITEKTFENTDKGKDLIECKNVNDMFDKLEI